jgi:hypothetical protein
MSTDKQTLIASIVTRVKSAMFIGVLASMSSVGCSYILVSSVLCSITARLVSGNLADTPTTLNVFSGPP